MPNHLKSKNKRNGVEVVVDESKQCPFAEHYDGHLHDVLANMRRLDGTIETHAQYGVPVNLFAPKGKRKYWVKASTPVLGYMHCVCYITALISNFTVAKGISCSWSWTRSYVLSWSSTLRCRYGTQPAKRPWMNCSMPKSMCTYYSFRFAFAPAGLTTLILFSYSEHGLVFRKEFVLNKNIVHLMDEIFWNLGFKHETHAETVILIIHIISIILIMCIILIICIIRIITGSSRTWTGGPRVVGQEEIHSPEP